MTQLDVDDLPSGYYRSLFPAECGGPRRQKAPHGAGLGIVPGERLVATARTTGRWNVMFLWRDPGELYLYSTDMVGTPDPHGVLERVDPITLDPVQTSAPLPTGGHIWCGAFVVHANGDLYVVNGRFLHRLDPGLSVIAERELPVDRPYNGVLVGADGALVTKEIRTAGERATIVACEPEGLDVVAQLDLPEASMGRIAADRIDGTDVIYVPGTEHLFRVHYAAGRFELDDAWRPRYRSSDDRHGLCWDTCLSMDQVWLQDNGDVRGVHTILDVHPTGSIDATMELPPPASFTVANRLMRIAVDDHTDVTTREPTGRPDGWIVAPPVAVQQHRIVVAYDSNHGQMVGYDVDQSGGLDVRWRASIRNWWQPMVYPDTAELVVDDARFDDGDDNLVVLDLLTGEEKARTATGSTLPNGMFPCPGERRDLYYVSAPTVARIAVTSD